jgi:hypothetical protein
MSIFLLYSEFVYNLNVQYVYYNVCSFQFVIRFLFSMCCWMIDRFGNEEQRSNWVPMLARYLILHYEAVFVFLEKNPVKLCLSDCYIAEIVVFFNLLDSTFVLYFNSN